MNTENNQSNEQSGVASIKPSFSLIKFIIFSFLTLGIYGIYFVAKMGSDLNVIASRRDGKRTMNYWLLILLITPITFGIAFFVWNHKFAVRIGDELKSRGLNYSVGAGTFWGWDVLGLLIAIGPFIYIYKLAKAMNMIITDYNSKG